MDTRLMLQAIEEERSRNAVRVARIAAAGPAAAGATGEDRARLAFLHAAIRAITNGVAVVAQATKLSRASRASVADR